MKIECIAEDRGSISIVVDDEYWGKTHKKIIVSPQKALESCVSIQELDERFKELEYRGALQFAAKHISLRAMTSKELQMKMKEHHVSKNTMQRVIHEFTKQGYLNDNVCLEAFLSGQQRRRYGPNAIVRKLESKGLKANSATLQAIMNPEVQKTAIQALVSTRYKNRNLANRKEKDKVIASLLRRGFELDIILSILPPLSQWDQ